MPVASSWVAVPPVGGAEWSLGQRRKVVQPQRTGADGLPGSYRPTQ